VENTTILQTTWHLIRNWVWMCWNGKLVMDLFAILRPQD